jgi:hypothetical protein
MRLFSAALQREIAQVASTHVFTCLFELVIPGAPGTYRLANYDQDVLFHGLPFLAYPVDVDSLEEATSSSLVHINVTTGNVDRQVMSLLENYWRDSPDWTATMWTIDATQADEMPFGAGQPYGVMNVASDLRNGTFDLLAEGWSLVTTVPKRRYTTTGGFPYVPRR